MVAFAKPHLKPHTPDRSAKDSGLRFYSAEISRWLNRDPVDEDGGLNLYGFVGNAPSYHVDPMGERVYLQVRRANIPFGAETFNMLHCILLIETECEGTWTFESSAQGTWNPAIPVRMQRLGAVPTAYRLGGRTSYTLPDGRVLSDAQAEIIESLDRTEFVRRFRGYLGGATGRSIVPRPPPTTEATFTYLNEHGEEVRFPIPFSHVATEVHAYTYPLGLADAFNAGWAAVGSTGPMDIYVVDDTFLHDDAYVNAAYGTPQEGWDLLRNNCCHWADRVIRAAAGPGLWPISHDINVIANPGNSAARPLSAPADFPSAWRTYVRTGGSRVP
jgi:RHS repeat-associated protein